MIYEAILQQAGEDWAHGRDPSAVRLNERTLKQLTEEFTQKFRFGRTSYGETIVSLNTEFGVLLMKVDPSMPDGCFTMQVRGLPLPQRFRPEDEDAEQT